MRRTLKLFVIPAGKSAGAPPEPGPDVELEAASDDALLAAAHDSSASSDTSSPILASATRWARRCER